MMADWSDDLSQLFGTQSLSQTNSTLSRRATVKPFSSSHNVYIPRPPSIGELQISQLDRKGQEIHASLSQYSGITGLKGILKGPHSPQGAAVIDVTEDQRNQLFWSSEPFLSPSISTGSVDDDLFNRDQESSQSFNASQHFRQLQFPENDEDHHSPLRNERRENTFERQESVGHGSLLDTPFCLNIPETQTPGGTVRPGSKLHSVKEVPQPFNTIFSFQFFNIVQSKVFNDALYSDKPMVVCAPTGSGKTVIFELGIVRLLLSMGSEAITRSKVVYMAPIKALCAQRCDEWKRKFERFGLQCQELTGDTEIDDFFQLQSANIIFTTPEKWDSMTRKWRDNKSLVQLVRLFLIDEIHSLNDEHRGATVEAVISRMKTIQSSMIRDASKGAAQHTLGLRFMGISATMPNIQDLAEWLGTDEGPAASYSMDESCRPVKLRKVVLGYSCSANQSGFRFDLSLNYKLSGIIHTYAEQKPTLVFCATRKGTHQAAGVLVKDARFIMNSQHKQRMIKIANSLKDSKLKDLILSGVGFHHAGMDISDRKSVEEMFRTGELPVLFSTSTLAMGVNLPAHLVIVKSTQHYVGGIYSEYSETQVLQMIGRAGRPQFDTSATAVILTTSQRKEKYEKLLGGKEDIESSLHNHLIEHLNAEIVLNTISDMSVALEWLKSTFLYIRMKKNPTYYGIPVGLTTAELEKQLKALCIRNLNLLASIDLIKMEEDKQDLKPTETGRLMARYCIVYVTMKRFTEISGTETLEELIALLSECKEFSDVKLRVSERKLLNTMNKDKNRITIRYPMKGKVKTAAMKVNCLIQATLGSMPVTDFGLSQDCNKIFRVAQRLSRCIQEYLFHKNHFRAFLNTLLMTKCVHAKLWENSKYVAKQLDKIGLTLATTLVNAGVVSFSKIEGTNPRELELIMNRHPPFGNIIQEAASHLPKYDVSLEQVAKYSNCKAEIKITVTLINGDALQETQTTKANHSCIMAIGDADNKLIFKVRVMDSQLLKAGPWTRRIEVTRTRKGDELSINLISQEYVGFDIQSSYAPFYSGPGFIKAVSAPYPVKVTPQRQSMEGSSKSTIPQGTTIKPASIRSGSKSGECNHKCMNKATCGHGCCKIQSHQEGPQKPKATTPENQPPKRKMAMEGYISELHGRMRGITQTPTAKRIKTSQTPSVGPAVDLAQFARTPLIETNQIYNTVAVKSVTPSLALSGKGWENLDKFHFRRNIQRQEEFHQHENEEPIIVESSSDESLPNFEIGESEYVDTKPRQNTSFPQCKFPNEESNFESQRARFQHQYPIKPPVTSAERAFTWSAGKHSFHQSLSAVPRIHTQRTLSYNTPAEPLAFFQHTNNDFTRASQILQDVQNLSSASSMRFNPSKVYEQSPRKHGYHNSTATNIHVHNATNVHGQKYSPAIDTESDEELMMSCVDAIEAAYYSKNKPKGLNIYSLKQVAPEERMSPQIQHTNSRSQHFGYFGKREGSDARESTNCFESIFQDIF